MKEMKQVINDQFFRISVSQLNLISQLKINFNFKLDPFECKHSSKLILATGIYDFVKDLITASLTHKIILKLTYFNII